jgi:cytochrome c
MRIHRPTYVSALPAVLAGLALAFAATAARADDPPATLDGATLYATRTCIACHGPDAKSPILPEYPKLAGQNAPYMLQQIKDIKSGARNNGNTAAMAGVLHLVNEAEMKVLVEYIAGLEP